ncbi:CocE/NonD family hydrolase [Nocardia gipuzkoensis]
MKRISARFGWLRTAAVISVAGMVLALLSCVLAEEGDGADARASSPWPGGSWAPAEVAYDSKLDSQLPVEMSDGVILKVDVSYPTDPVTGQRARGPFPVLLTQTPYLNTQSTAGDYFVQRGYLFITAYVRGTTTSGGNFSFFGKREAQDGAELVTWAATRLENSNGKVGLTGGSYAGINQMYTVAEAGAHSPIQAIAPYCMGAEFYREAYFAGGIPTQTLNFQRVIGSSMGGNTVPIGAALVDEINFGGPRAYDGAFWQERTPGNLAQKIVDAGVPGLLWSSNGDIYAQSSLELYSYFQNASRRLPVFGPMSQDQKATGRYQVIMSQGGHCENQDQRITLEWFDTWLKGARTGIESTTTPLHAHEMVSDRWLNTSAYPVVPSYTRYYLTANRALSPTVPDTTGEDNVAWAQPAANSTLQYDSPAFENGGTLAGPISASFYASSTTSNLELIATVHLIGANGSVTPVSSGTVLGSLAANDPSRSWSDAHGVPVRLYGKYTAPDPVPAGAIKKYDFAISPRFAHIPVGSKLRLTVTTQTPTANCSPLLGVDPCFPTAPEASSLAGATETIYHGPATSSSLNLPLLKADCWQSTENPNPQVPYWNASSAADARTPCQK